MQETKSFFLKSCTPLKQKRYRDLEARNHVSSYGEIEFEYPKMSKVIAVVGFFELSKFQPKEHNHFSDQNFPYY